MHSRVHYSSVLYKPFQVSVRFRLYGVSVCVLNSHLAAHTQFNQDRIDSYNR